MRFDSSNVFLIVQDVLVSVACVTAPLFTHQKEKGGKSTGTVTTSANTKLSRERATRTPGSIGFRQPIRTKVLSYHGNFTGA